MRSGEGIWREAWVGAAFAGTVVIAPDPGSGEEMLFVQCQDVVDKFGENACIVDDGRTVGICVDDSIAFGVVRRPGRAPLAVNVYRLPAAKRRRIGEKGKGGQKGGSKAGFVFPTELPESLRGSVPGVIRNQSMTTGDYFIACPAVNTAYMKDPKIPVQDMPTGVGLGDCITFSLEHPEHDRASPIASNVQRKAGPEAEDIYVKTYPWKGRKGKGKGGKGSRSGKGGQFAPVPGSWRPEAVMRMVGIVKHKSPVTGCHFILCQDLSDVYGKDAQLPQEEIPEGGVKVGDRIAFDADEPRNGQQGVPLVRNVRVVDSAGAKRKVAAAGGDGEDEGDGEPEEDLQVEEEVEAEEEPEKHEDEEGDLDGEDLRDAEEEARLQAAEGDAEVDLEENPPTAAEVGVMESQAAEVEESIEGTGRRRFALTWAEFAQAGKASAGRAPSSTLKEPETPEEWAAQQDRKFPGMPPLRKHWIRIFSKSKGLIYYYNMLSGESSTVEPSR